MSKIKTRMAANLKKIVSANTANTVNVASAVNKEFKKILQDDHKPDHFQKLENKVKKESKAMLNDLFSHKSTEQFVNSINNSIEGVIQTANDCTRQTQIMLTRVSSGAGEAIEQNMAILGGGLKCQTASDVIDLHQKCFKLNFSNMINFCSEIHNYYHTVGIQYYNIVKTVKL